MKKRFLVSVLGIFCLISSCGQVGKWNSEMEEVENIIEIESTFETESEIEIIDLHEYDFTLCFAGDISLDESAVTTAQLDASENGIYDCISPELIEIMKDADIMCLNNEFTYSSNGAPMAGKCIHFVQILRAYPCCRKWVLM